MAVATLRPNITLTNTGPWTTGSASVHAALSDSSDATTVAAPAVSLQLLTLGFGDLTLPAGAIIQSAQVKVRATGGGRSLLFRLKTAAGITSPDETITPTGTITTYAGAAQQTDGNFAAWTDATLDTITLELFAFGTTGAITLYEIELVVTVSTIPVVTVTSPAGTITTTTRPDILWSWTDPDGNNPAVAEAKIFDQATYTAAGFDPTTSAAIWASGTTFLPGGVAPFVLGFDLSNTFTYRAYVRAAKLLGGDQYHYSSWALATFTISITPPAAPVLDAVGAENEAGRIAITISHPGGSPAASYLTVEYSDDAGASWANVRNAGQIAAPNPPVGGSATDPYTASYLATYGTLVPGTAGSVTVYDHEAPPLAVRQYRARALALSAGLIIAGPNSATNSGRFEPRLWWLKDPSDPTLNLEIPVLGPDSSELDEPAAEFAALGRARPIILADDLDDDLPEHSEHTLLVRGADPYARVRRLLVAQRILLLQSPFGDHRYVRIIARRVSRTLTPTNPRREITITARHVDPPAEIPNYLIWDQSRWDEAVYA